MPHAVEMPAVLAESTGGHSNMLSSNSNRPQFDLPSHLRHSHEKVNGTGRSSSHSSIKNTVADGDYGDAVGGRNSIETSHYDPALNSMPNGRTSAGSWDQNSRPLRNDSSLSVNGGTNGVVDRGRRSPGPGHYQNGVTRTSNGDRVSIASTTNGVTSNGRRSEDISRVNGGSPEPFKRVDVPAPISMNPQSTGPLTYHTSLVPATPNLNERPPRSSTVSPHRLSSPPSYAPPGIPSSSTASLPHPGQTTLKHRHTLQVPKPGPGRSSKDGEEAVYSSGRLSPTQVTHGMRRGSLSLNRRNTQSIHSNMPHEEIPPDEDAMRWAEAVRQKRASKRKRKDDEEDDRVVVGTKVDQNHVNWVTAYNMLTGIRFTVSRTNAKMDRPLTEADFDAKHKFSFDITGNELTPSAKYDFKFKDYAPWVFRHLRAKFKLDPADYLMSLTSKYILSELGSPGKSGSFFYFSRDYKYIIKTIHHGEHKFLRKILKDYYSHVEDNPNTLLSQFYGLHRVKIPYGRKIHFVVMNNLFPPHRDIHQTFDLKGSTIGRDFKEEDLEHNPRATLKDLNWLRRNLNLELGPEKKSLFIEQMEKDVKLLQKLKIMDYSMLVGVHDLRKGNEENLRDKTLQVFQPGGDVQGDEVEATVGPGRLMRTPSKLETMRKAKELRQIIKQEKPVPLGQSSSKMLDEMEENANKKDFIFYSDDGGFRATHEDNSPGDEIFFLSIIDCLTHWGTVKRLENFWKGLSNDKKLLSPINPEPYGERFKKFIEGITKSPEEAARENEVAAAEEAIEMTESGNNNTSSTRRRSGSLGMHLGMQRTGTMNSTLQRNEHEANKKADKEAERPDPRTIGVVRSPSADRSGGMQGQILPVVEEIGEASSNGGGRSLRSVRSFQSTDGRPKTPPKDTNREFGRLSVENGEERRPRTPVKDWVVATNGNVNGNGNGIASPRISRSSLDKDLPALPPSLVNGNGKGKERSY